MFAKKKSEENEEANVDKEINTSEILGFLRELPKLLPKLDEKKEILDKDIHRLKDKIAETENLILKLDEKKKLLHQDVERLQEEVLKIDTVNDILKKI